MKHLRTILAIAALAVAPTALAACGGDDGAPSAGAAPAPPAPPEPPEIGGYGSAAEESTPSGTETAPADAPIAQVNISDSAFSPPHLTVEPGQTVVWTNSDSTPHTVTGEDGADLDSGEIAPGASYVWKPAESGEIAYICSIHPEMQGMITVE